MEKLPFIVAALLFPYQLIRILRSKSPQSRSVDILITALIIPMCLTSWPVHLNFRIAFSLISVVFSAVMLCEYFRWKNTVYLMTFLFLLIVSGLLILMFLFDFSNL